MHRSRGVSGGGVQIPPPPGKFKFIKVSKIGLEHLPPPPSRFTWNQNYPFPLKNFGFACHKNIVNHNKTQSYRHTVP